MRRIVKRHLARLRRARQAPEELEGLTAHFYERIYPCARSRLRRARQERIPAHVPDWYFESELRRSGLWAMMERCYPTAEAQSQ